MRGHLIGHRAIIGDEAEEIPALPGRFIKDYVFVWTDLS